MDNVTEQKHVPVSQAINWLGYRFCPTDSEAFNYLHCKVYAESIENIKLEFIQEHNIYECEPRLLPGLGKGEEYSYYFTTRILRFSKGNRFHRGTRDEKGYWRITSKISRDYKEGKKNTLVYYLKEKSEKGKGRKTSWIMHEYVLGESSSSKSTDKVNDVVLCRIYERNPGEVIPERESTSYDSNKDSRDVASSSKRKLDETSTSEVDESSSSHGNCQLNKVHNLPDLNVEQGEDEPDHHNRSSKRRKVNVMTKEAEDT